MSAPKSRVLRKPFYTIDEVLHRWEVTTNDVAAFALADELVLSIPAAGVSVEIGDLVEHEDGTLERNPDYKQYAVRTLDLFGHDAWHVLRNGSQSVGSFAASPGRYADAVGGAGMTHDVILADLVLRHDEMSRFEQSHEILPASQDAQSTERQCDAPVSRTRGTLPQYEWDEFWCEAFVSVYVNGMPEAQAKLVRQMEDWFAKRGKYPDKSTIKKKVALLWRRYHEAGARV